MSDIHGHFDEFQKMLDQIGFSERDELILAGDYVDRGPQTCEMMRWAETCAANVLLLKGNHDVEFAECINIMDAYGRKLGLDVTDTADTQTLYLALRQIPALQSAYFDYYGTIENLITEKVIAFSEMKRWASLIGEMPYFYRRTVDGKRFIIVHAGYYEDKSISKEKLEQFYIYARTEAFSVGGVPGTTIISGHTPTVIKGMLMYTNGEVFRLYDKEKDCVFYDIDCGCGYKGLDYYENCRLACIRLEDERVFYVS